MKGHSNAILIRISKSKIFIITLLTALSFACSPEDGRDGLQGEQGEQGIQGEQGAPGIDGNANVRKYTITIANTDWNNGVHGGNDNVFNYYDIPESLTGGIRLSDQNYLVVAYGAPTGFDYSTKKPLPYTLGIDDNYGIKFEMAINRDRVMMFKTTNGWNSATIPLAQRPSTFTLDIFMIEVKAANSAKAKIDLNNYTELVEYFKIK